MHDDFKSQYCCRWPPGACRTTKGINWSRIINAEIILGKPYSWEDQPGYGTEGSTAELDAGGRDDSGFDLDESVLAFQD